VRLLRRKRQGPTLVVYGLVESLSFDEVMEACHRILDALRPQLTYARIDGFSDIQELPDEARMAKEALEAMAVQRHEGQLREGSARTRWWAQWSEPHAMGIELDPQNDEHFELLKTFGPYTIHAEIYRADQKSSFFTMHDTGSSVSFECREDEAEELIERAQLPREWIERDRPL
jgi:hypothetical protein